MINISTFVIIITIFIMLYSCNSLTNTQETFIDVDGEIEIDNQNASLFQNKELEIIWCG